MMLGALPTMQEANQRIQNLQSSPYNLQTFATKTGQAYSASTNTSPVNVEQPSSPAPQETDYLAMAKKYAPYLIGAIVLYYLILKNK